LIRYMAAAPAIDSACTVRGMISLLIGNKFTVTLTGKQPAGGVSGMLTVDTRNVSLLLIICTIYFIVVC